jgi:hypothetical protein
MNRQNVTMGSTASRLWSCASVIGHSRSANLLTQARLAGAAFPSRHLSILDCLVLPAIGGRLEGEHTGGQEASCFRRRCRPATSPPVGSWIEVKTAIPDVHLAIIGYLCRKPHGQSAGCCSAAVKPIAISNLSRRLCSYIVRHYALLLLRVTISSGDKHALQSEAAQANCRAPDP